MKRAAEKMPDSIRNKRECEEIADLFAQDLRRAGLEVTRVTDNDSQSHAWWFGITVRVFPHRGTSVMKSRGRSLVGWRADSATKEALKKTRTSLKKVEAKYRDSAVEDVVIEALPKIFKEWSEYNDGETYYDSNEILMVIEITRYKTYEEMAKMAHSEKDIRHKLIRLGSEQPELKNNITQVLAALEAKQAGTTERWFDDALTSLTSYNTNIRKAYGFLDYILYEAKDLNDAEVTAAAKEAAKVLTKQMEAGQLIAKELRKVEKAYRKAIHNTYV